MTSGWAELFQGYIPPSPALPRLGQKPVTSVVFTCVSLLQKAGTRTLGGAPTHMSHSLKCFSVPGNFSFFCLFVFICVLRQITLFSFSLCFIFYFLRRFFFLTLFF